MNRLPALLIFAFPAVASAHAGHEHVGNPIMHHLVDGLLLAAIVGAAFFLVQAVLKRVGKSAK